MEIIHLLSILWCTFEVYNIMIVCVCVCYIYFSIWSRLMYLSSYVAVGFVKKAAKSDLVTYFRRIPWCSTVLLPLDPLCIRSLDLFILHVCLISFSLSWHCVDQHFIPSLCLWSFCFSLRIYGGLCVWLILLSKPSSSFIHVVAGGKFSFEKEELYP